MSKLQEIYDKNIEKLELYVPVVARVHGGSHPEFLEVQEIYIDLIEQIKTAGPDLAKGLKKMQAITNNYTVPEDVCETYEAVYQMLAELDQAYQADQN